MTDTERRALKQKLAWAERNGYVGDELGQFMGVMPTVIVELRRELTDEDTANLFTHYQQRRTAVQRLVWMITEKGMTQGEVGDKLGMKQGEVSDILKGWEKRPNTPTLSIQKLIGYVAKELGAPSDQELPDPSAYSPKRGRRAMSKAASDPSRDKAVYDDLIRMMAFGTGSMSEEEA
ncbi:MAG: hypothetical protein U0768_09150 [Anaerolineae bacterium]